MAGEPLPLTLIPPAADVDVSAATSALESAAAGIAGAGAAASAAATSGVDVSVLLSSADPALVTNLHTSVAFALRFVFAAAGLGAVALARWVGGWVSGWLEERVGG